MRCRWRKSAGRLGLRSRRLGVKVTKPSLAHLAQRIRTIEQNAIGRLATSIEDAVLALAFEHHLAIARNVPLHRVVGWLTKWAPAGVIEFVEKSDPTVQKMLALREDIIRRQW